MLKDPDMPYSWDRVLLRANGATCNADPELLEVAAPDEPTDIHFWGNKVPATPER